MKIVKIILVSLLLGLIPIGLAAADYTGPNRTVTTTVWERQDCNYRATVTSPAGTCFLTLYFSPGSCPATASVAGYFNNAATACGTSWPGTCGSGLSCSIVLLTGSTESCSSGETGCTGVTHTSTYPPATVRGTTACTLPGSAGWCRGTGTLDLSGNEPLAPAYHLTTFESSSGLLCAAPACTWTFPEGRTSLDFWVHSSYGDTSTMASASMQVDSLAPVLTLTIPPVDGENGWYLSPPTMTAAASDATSGLAEVQVQVDGGGWTSAASLEVPEGVHVVQFQASDVAGNRRIESRTISVDATPPTLVLALPAPDGNAGWYTNGLAFSASASDTNSGVQSVAYSLDGGDPSTGAGHAWQAGPLFLEEGSYSILTRVTDLAGNVATRTDQVNVDPTPPQSTFLTPVEGSQTVLHGTFTLSGQTLDLTSGPAAAELSLDGGTTWQPLAISGATWSYDWDTNTVPNGTYTLLVRASDTAGNEEHTARVTVVVANQGPQVRITESWWLWEQAEISIQGSGLPVSGAQITISDGLGHLRTYNFGGGELPVNLKWDGIWDDGLVAPAGDFAVVVTAWDAFGNSGLAGGTVRIPAARPTPTAEPTPSPAAPPPAAAASPATAVPPGTSTPAPVPAAAKPQNLPRPPVLDPIYLWPTIGLVGLLAALASAAWADRRPSALQRLANAFPLPPSKPEETRHSQSQKGEK